jgi:hypothetical protein
MRMDHEQVTQLLQKYWQAETTLAEENALKDFFSVVADLPPEIEKCRPFFVYCSSELMPRADIGDLTAKLRQQWSEPAVRQIFPLKKFLRYAAILPPLILLSYFLWREPGRSEKDTVQVETFIDPDKARTEMKKTLLVLSKNMNDGLAALEAIQLMSELPDRSKKTSP